MKRFLPLLILASLLAASLHGCRVRPSDWNLDAQWQIMDIAYANGDSDIPSSPRRYISFYRSVIQFTSNEGARISGNLAYDESAGTMAIEIPHWDGYLASWGLDAPADPDTDAYTTVLTVRELTSSRLVLVTPAATVITLRKY